MCSHTAGPVVAVVKWFSAGSTVLQKSQQPVLVLPGNGWRVPNPSFLSMARVPVPGEDMHLNCTTGCFPPYEPPSPTSTQRLYHGRHQLLALEAAIADKITLWSDARLEQSYPGPEFFPSIPSIRQPHRKQHCWAGGVWD